MTRFSASFLCLALLSPAIPLFAAEHFVAAGPGFTFTPDFLEIAVGDTVTWTNAGGLHNVNAPGFFRCANGCDGEGGNGNPSNAPWSFSRTFDSDATINYDCEVHQPLGMTGSVVVGSGVPPAILEVLGICPGTVTIQVTGLLPNSPTGLLFSPQPGNSTIVGGPCDGTETGLTDPRLLTVRVADGNGEISLVREAPAAACGAVLQAVDGSTCAASTVGALP